MNDHYDTLGVERSATPEEIKAAYRRMSMRCHPDRPGGSNDKFRPVKEAYDVLGDPTRREDYDAGGEGAKKSPVEQRAQELLQALFRDHVVRKVGFYGDPVKQLREMLITAGRQGAEAMLNNKKAAEHAERMAQTVVRTDRGENYLAEVALAYADECRKRVACDRENLEVVSSALHQLNDFLGFGP